MTMQTVRAGLVMALALLALTACGGEPPREPEEPKEPPKRPREVRLDHFLVYDTSGFELEAEVWLKGQFDEEARPARLVSVPFFANPVAKVHGEREWEIRDRNAHLVWYKFEQEPEPRRTVRLENQFGRQSLDVEESKFLLVPAQKLNDREGEFPKELDHYKCYTVVRVNLFEPGAVARVLKDQFGALEEVKIEEPEFFCVPVVKRREGEEPRPIFNEKDHLTFYRIRQEERPVEVKVRDQFGEHGFETEITLYLGVPSLKEIVVTHDEG